MDGLAILWIITFVSVLGTAATIWAYIWLNGADDYLSLWPVATFVLAIVNIIAGSMAGIGYAEQVTCQRQANDLQRDWTYSVIAECRVESDAGLMVPLDNLRITSEEDA